MGVPEATRRQLRDYYSSSRSYIGTMRTHDEEYFTTYVALVAAAAAPIRSASPRLLELGCGSGSSTRSLARVLDRFSCVGIDVSQPAIEFARRFGDAGLGFAVADCLRLPFADGTFSLVASCDVIEHMPDPAQALTEMARLVEPGGAVVIKAPHHRNPILPLVDLVGLRARYPFTKTWRENLPRLVDLSIDFVRKAMSETIDYRTRIPDLSDATAVGNDADAVYEVSVLDLIRFFRRRGFAIENVACARRNILAARIYTRAFPYMSSIGLVARRGANAAGTSKARPEAAG